MKTRHVTALCLSVLFLMGAIVFTVFFIDSYNDYHSIDWDDSSAMLGTYFVGIALAIGIHYSWVGAIVNSILSALLPLFVLCKYGKGINALCICLSGAAVILSIALVILRYCVYT